MGVDKIVEVGRTYVVILGRRCRMGKLDGEEYVLGGSDIKGVG